ncbi:hypothetical protein HHL19_16685 [Streptomyces sp. R302]|uniref:hypothetical protein n=1 Tax=unclassified Streptomyces TaxID=2593676 RepID=UPI00145D9695|nr:MULTISPECIES: hypothetical protein [unclassified Streptomyces]NML55406.1 hypothetical protein [Streptomyces sp. R301]NML80278.1 hypothetical protein [Streptomyces sp. R302]
MAIPGNFLSLATSTLEPNVTGWTPLLNCTISRATGGTASDGCLQVRSVAGGEMRCRTSANYAVLPGVEYLVLADASGATVPERIGIRWLTSASTEISITWSLTTATASAAWHRIAVAGYAPVDAAFAQVVVSSTPAAGAVNSLFDNLYLGLPQRTTGNLLSANAETHERAANWEYTAGTNSTITRAVPMVNWPATFYLAGGHVAAMTVTANGDADFRCTETPVVTPGTEYEAYGYLQPPTSGTAAWIELRFFDGVGAQIQATRAVLSAPGTGWYRQRVSAIAPTGAETAGLAFGLAGATAGQIMRLDTVVILAASRPQAGSIVPLSDADFEFGIGSWTTVSGAATLSRTTPWGTAARRGSYSMTVSSATATASVIRTGQYTLATTDTHRAVIEVLVGAGGWTVATGVRFYDDVGTEISSSSSSTIPIPGAGWWFIASTSDPPPNAVKVALEYTVTATAPSSTLRVDQVSYFPALPLFEANPKEETASVDLVVRELEVGNELSLWRTTPTGERTFVRGPDGLIDRTLITDTQFLVQDYEAPLGVLISYTHETYEVGTTAPDRFSVQTATIPAGDPNFSWLKDPSSPQRNLRVLTEKAPDWQRSVVQGEHRVRGRRNSIIFSDVRGGLEGELRIWTRSDDERKSLHWLLDPGRILLWQAVPGMGIDDVYVAVGQVVEGRTVPQAQELWRSWTLPLRQVDMPAALGVAGSADRTWQDILSEHATWGDVLARFETWEDVFLNRPKG